VASEAVDILVLQIMTTLQQPISNLFSPQWLSDSATTADLTLTMKDFFDDYSRWISRPAYFSRIVHHSLHSLTQEYIRRLIDVKPQLNTDFFNRLKADQILFDSFFMNYSHLLSVNIIVNELSFIQLIQAILQADPDAIQHHFNKIEETWKEKGNEIIEVFIQMRNDLNKQQKKSITEQFLNHRDQQLTKTKQQKSNSSNSAKTVSTSLKVNSDVSAVLELNSSLRSRSSSSLNSSNFVVPSFTSSWSVFQNRGKPAFKTKPSLRTDKFKSVLALMKHSRNTPNTSNRNQRGTKHADKDNEQTINLEDFIA